jgi:tripartite-type tricarboxylate transporter receptor subunit TctC
VTIYAAQLPTTKMHVDSGRLRALATAGSTRAMLMSDLPTVAESGYPGFEVTTWYAFFASSKVPGDILNYWNRELGKVLRDPAVAAELSKQGLDPSPGTREELAAVYSAEIEKWEALVREGKVKLE